MTVILPNGKASLPRTISSIHGTTITVSSAFAYEDDDGNSDIEEGLFFYLADITFTNNMIALVTSYDPEVKGTVDFNITSDNQLMIIPEPAAISLLFTAGILLIVLRKNKRLV